MRCLSHNHYVSKDAVISHKDYAIRAPLGTVFGYKDADILYVKYSSSHLFDLGRDCIIAIAFLDDTPSNYVTFTAQIVLS